MPAQVELCHAIDNMRFINCRYGGHNRTVLPLVLFRNDDDELVLNGWQTGGTNSRREIPSWVNMLASEIRAFVVTRNPFSHSQIPDDYNPERYDNRVCWAPKRPT